RLVVQQESLRARTDLYNRNNEQLRDSQQDIRLAIRDLLGQKSEARGDGKGGDEDGKPGVGSGSSKAPGSKGSARDGSGTPGLGKGDDQPREEGPVKKLLDDAQKYMKQAEVDIKMGKKGDASDEQGKALQQLDAAREKLEDVLEQMRE